MASTSSGCPESLVRATHHDLQISSGALKLLLWYFFAGVRLDIREEHFNSKPCLALTDLILSWPERCLPEHSNRSYCLSSSKNVGTSTAKEVNGTQIVFLRLVRWWPIDRVRWRVAVSLDVSFLFTEAGGGQQRWSP